MIAHNASFDVGILAIEAGRIGLNLPNDIVLDSISIAKSFLPRQRNYQLPTLTEILGLNASGMHRALPDAIAVKTIVEAAITSISGWKDLPLNYLLSRTRAVSFSDYISIDIDLPPAFSLLSEALEAELAVRIIYDGGSKGQAPRVITPSGLFARKGLVYIEAFCHRDNISKSFRLDRILKIELDNTQR